MAGKNRPVCPCGSNKITVNNRTGMAKCLRCNGRGKLVIASDSDGVWLEIKKPRRVCPGYTGNKWCHFCAIQKSTAPGPAGEIYAGVCLDYEEGNA